MPDSCLVYAGQMSVICRAYAFYMPDLCLLYGGFMSPICRTFRDIVDVSPFRGGIICTFAIKSKPLNFYKLEIVIFACTHVSSFGKI